MKTLSKKDIKQLNERIGREVFSKKDLLQEECGRYYRNKELVFFTLPQGRLAPSLKFLLKDLYLPKVTVDMGAVKFVVGGADIMRPGVTACDEGVMQGDLVVVVDETHGKPLAVGEALMGSEELLAATSGKVVKNLHYVGDDLWNA
ncbi:RNA-binding protein [Candidatus Woesearchaeota archaeon]|nr:MAG: RNA-binding protein [Candidatus Woesearchaeota archaeon]